MEIEEKLLNDKGVKVIKEKTKDGKES